MGINTAAVQRLYVAYFNRPADTRGLAKFEAMLEESLGAGVAAGQADLAAITGTFSSSAEYKSMFEGLDSLGTVNQLYLNIFGRAADVGGLVKFADDLDNGVHTVDSLALYLSYAAQGTDATVVQARIDAAIEFTNGIDTAEEVLGYSGNAAAAEGRAYLAQISGELPTDDATIKAEKDAAIENVDVSILSAVEAGGSNPGETFTLTTGIDALVGTNKDDTFSGTVLGDGAAGTTVQAGDSIVGGGGTGDTFTISVAGAVTATYTVEAVSLAATEVLNITNFDTAANDAFDHVVDAVLMTGLTDVKLSASNATGDTTVSNLSGLVDLTVANGAADATLGYNAGVVVGTADTQNIKVYNTSAGTVTVAGVETVNLSVGSVAATLDALTVANASTLNVTGAKDLTISTAIDFADDASGVATALDGTLNAATFTGKLSVGANAADNVSITGGTKDDTFVMAGGLDTNDTIKGGDGADTISMDSGAISTQFTNVSEVETVAFNDTATAYTVAADKLGADVKTISMAIKDDTADGNETAFAVTGYTEGTTVSLTRADFDTDLDDAPKVTIQELADTVTDSVTVALTGVGVNGDDGGGVAADEFGIGTLDVNNFETVNIASAKTTTQTANELISLLANSATSLTLTGNAALTLGTITLAATASSVDASAMTGALTLTAGTYNATYKMPTVSSTLNFGTALNNQDTVIGGAGTADVVNADVSGASSTTGALNISAVETVNLDVDTTAAVVDAASVSGQINIYQDATGTGAKMTLSNLAAGQIVGLGRAATFESNGQVVLSLADATGTDDAMTVAIMANDADDDIDANVDIAGVETVTFAVNASTKDVQLDVAGVAASKILVSGGLAGEELDLTNGGTTKLNVSVTEVDASGHAGHIRVDASAASAPGITITASAATVAHNITGTGNADTITIVGATGNAEAISGGAGSDVLNITLDSTFTDATNIAGIETVNLVQEAGEDVDTTGNGLTDATVDFVNLIGGNALSTFTMNGFATGMQKFDASGFGGNVVLALAANDTLDSSVEFIGGALSTDAVSGSYSAAGPHAPKTTGIEILSVTNAATNTPVLSLASTTGVTRVNVTNSQADTFKVSGVTDQTVNITAAANAASITEVILADASGTSDTLNMEIDAATAQASIKTDDIETLNLKVDGNVSLTMDQHAMTAAGKTMSIVLSGAGDFTVNDQAAMAVDVTVLDASAMTGALNTADALAAGNMAATQALTIKGGAAADTILGGAAGDTLTGNGGADQFNVTAHSNKFIYDTVTDASNGDKLYITAAAAVDATVQNSWGVVSLSEAAGFVDYLDEAAKGAGNVNNILQWFVYDGNTYVVSDNSAGAAFVSGTDDVICLSGVLDLSQSVVATTNGTNSTVITLDVDGA